MCVLSFLALAFAGLEPWGLMLLLKILDELFVVGGNAVYYSSAYGTVTFGSGTRLSIQPSECSVFLCLLCHIAYVSTVDISVASISPYRGRGKNRCYFILCRWSSHQRTLWEYDLAWNPTQVRDLKCGLVLRNVSMRWTYAVERKMLWTPLSWLLIVCEQAGKKAEEQVDQLMPSVCMW